MLDTWKSDHTILSRCFFYVAFLLFAASGIFAVYEFIYPLLLSSSQVTQVQAPPWWSLAPLVVFLLVLFPLRPEGVSRTHGSAHFATLPELRRAQLIHKPVPVAPATTTALLPAPGETTAVAVAGAVRLDEGPESLLELGWRGHRRTMIALTEKQQESHVLIVAPSGKRKSSGFFIPALLQERGHRSLIINDVKDELYRLTAGAVSRYHQVFVFSPTRPERSNGYNPLAHISTSKEARDFARTWVENTGVSAEAFYNDAAKNLITAGVLHLIDTEAAPALAQLADLLATKTLDEIKTILLASSSARARNTANAFLQALDLNPKVSSGILLGTANRFSMLLDSEDYRQATSYDDLDFEALVSGGRPTALYINVPASATEDLKPLTSVLLSQIMTYLTKRAEEEPDGRLPRHVVLYLDEFANAGRLPDVEKNLTLVRGAGIAYILAIQDFGQLDQIYGRNIGDTILSGTTTQITLPGVGQREAEYFSNRLGMATVQQRSTGTSTRQGGLLARGDVTTSTTQSETKRPLMLPEEIRQMPIGQFVMVSDNAAPVLGTFHTYIERPQLVDLTALKAPGRVVVIPVEEAEGVTPQDTYQPEEI